MDVELSSLLASLCMAFLVFGLNAPEAVTLASGHQVPAHKFQVAVVAPEEVAFVSPLTVVERVGDLYIIEPDKDRRFDTA